MPRRARSRPQRSRNRRDAEGTAPDAPEWALAVEDAQFVLNGLHAIALWWFDNKVIGKEALVDLVASLLWKGLSALEAARSPGSGRMDLPADSPISRF